MRTREDFIEKWFMGRKKANHDINTEGITLLYFGYTLDWLNDTIKYAEMKQMANALSECGYRHRKNDVLITKDGKIPYIFNVNFEKINKTIGHIIHIPTCKAGYYLAGYLLHLHEDNWLKEKRK